MPNSQEREKRIWQETLLSGFAGACIMAAELLVARVLAPLLGAGIETWAGVIGATLAWSGTGALLSTKLSGKDEKTAAGTWLALAGAGLAWAAWITTNVPGGLPSGAIWAAGATSLVIGPTALCLGALLPTATARATRKCANPDRAAAHTSAAATAGSVLGTLATPLLILPNIGNNMGLAGLGILCTLIGVALVRTTKTVVCLVGAIAVAGTLNRELADRYRTLGKTTKTVESAYQRIMVKENSQGEKALVLNNQVAGSQNAQLQLSIYLKAAGGRQKDPRIYAGRVA